jgi:hypothetical protein
MHWDGVTWRSDRIPSHDYFPPAGAVAASSASDAWLIGDAVEHWDGKRWRQLVNQQGGFTGAVALSADDIWAVGSRIAHYTGGLCYPSNPVGRTFLDAKGMEELAIDQSNHRLFVAHDDGTLSMYNATTGTLLRTAHTSWTYEGAINSGLISRRVVIDEGVHHVFLVNHDANTVIMADADIGQVLRVTKVGDHPGSAVLDAKTHQLFVLDLGTGDYNAGAETDYSEAKLSALDTRTGGLEYTVPVGGVAIDRSHPDFQSPYFNDECKPMAVAQQLGLVMVDTGNGVVVLAAATGRTLWTKQGVGGGPGSNIGVDEDAGLFYVYDPYTGQMHVYAGRTGKAITPQTSAQPAVSLGAPLLIAAGYGAYLVDATSGTILKGLATGDIVAIDSLHRRAVTTLTTTRPDQYGGPENATLQVVDDTGQPLYIHPLNGALIACALDEKSSLAYIAVLDSWSPGPTITVYDTRPPMGLQA